MDTHTVSDDFASYFRKIHSLNNQQLKHEYQSVRDVYHGMPISDAHVIDTELVESVVATLNRGKAAGSRSFRRTFDFSLTRLYESY